MSVITFKHTGDFKKTSRFFKNSKLRIKTFNFDKYGKMGVDALSNATPSESGKTSQSWYYEVDRKPDSISITWNNSNVNDGVPIAIILQYGHGTNHGGYVHGRDYINPAIQPIFDEILSELWKEVRDA